MIEEERSEPAKRLSISQIVFESEDGELVSLKLQRVDGVSSFTIFKGGPWTEATIGTFPCGRFASTDSGLAVTGSIELTELTENTPALAFTTYWRPWEPANDSDNSVLISHGYSMAVGPFIVLLQHTSDRVITPEFVADLAHLLIKRIGEKQKVNQPSDEPESELGGEEKLKSYECSRVLDACPWSETP